MNNQPLVVEYIESGTYQGSEEEAGHAGIERGEECIVMHKDNYNAMRSALTKISEFEDESIWYDDRDDAAGLMVSIAEKALKGIYDYE